MELTRTSGNQPSLKGLCDHCSNTTLQVIVSSELGRYNGKMIFYSLTRCTICDGIALRKHPDDLIGPVQANNFNPDPSFPAEQIWPPSSSFSSDIPARISAIYQEAHSVRKKSPSSFVVQLRRAFEVMAKDRQADGRTLNDQIKWLIAQGHLPPVFAGMIQTARRIGNMGAHDSEREVTPEDAELADSFFRAIIEYLYVAPALLAKVKNEPGENQVPE